VEVAVVVVRDVNVPKARIVHFLGEQIELCMAIAEENVVAAFAPDIMPGAAPVGFDPVAVPGRIPSDDLVRWAHGDLSRFDRFDLRVGHVRGHMPSAKGVHAKLSPVTIAKCLPAGPVGVEEIAGVSGAMEERQDGGVFVQRPIGR